MVAVITAGGRLRTDFARAVGSEFKALAPLGSRRRLIDPAIDAARELGVTAIAVVGPAAVTAYAAGRIDRAIDAVDDGVTNIVRALRAFPQADRLLYLTCDLPFIDATALRYFAERSQAWAVTMALSPAAAYALEYPGAPPHAVRLGNDAYANGSAFIIDRTAVAGVERLAGRFFSARKSLPRLAALLGPVLCLRYAVGRLSVADIEGRATRALGVSARAVTDAAPALCYDVDDIADWVYADSLATAYE